MEVWTPFFLFIALAVGTFAAPTETCAKPCVTVYNSKFKYDVGKVYSYNYEASSIIGVNGGATEVPGVKLKAVAEIHVITPCEFSLKLTNVNFQGNENPNPPRAGDLKKALEAQTLAFSYTDGRVDHLCPNKKDPVFSVNIKRAVLSAFQNSMDKGLESHVREADIVGLCDTHYKEGTKPGEIIKTKDIHSCTNRQGNFTSLQARHYDSSSHFQTAPIVAPSHECAQVLGDGIIKSVNCKEVQKFKLYSKGDKGTYTETKTSLTYTKTGKSNAKAARGADHESLFFDHTDDYDTKSNKPETEKVLKEICANSEDGDVDANSAELFARLVYLVRRLSVAEIRTYLASTQTCKSPKAKDTLVGALLSAGSESSLRILVEILKKGEISKLRSRLWHFSLAFNARPTLGTVEALTPLIEGDAPSRTDLLGVSTHVWGYCRQHADCEKEKAVLKVLDILGKYLGKNCRPKDNAEEDRIVIALKSFGNIGHVGKHENTILTCAKDTTLVTEIRLAAIEAFRRHAANPNVISTFTHLLEDHKENTEVRIASYLSLIKRADSKIANKIEDILNHEEVDQVTSFIWSHVKNLQKTESPLRQEIKHLAQSIHFNHKYISDPRKYSRNYEASFFSDKYNLGGNIDSNVIFSPDSFLPRSGMLNFTVDVFGSSLNLLEVDVRTRNFESLLEAYFGPNGKLFQQTPLELANEFRQRWRSIAAGIEEEAADHPHDHSKHKRDLPYSPQKLRDKQTKGPSGTPHGSFSFKIFGNELSWRNFHNLDEVYDKSDPYNLQDIFNALAKHKEIDLARNWMFVDTTFTIPTASGFPIKWDLNGSLSAGLKLSSHFDVRELFLRPRNCDIKSFIQPSVNIQWGGAFLIDAHVGKVGFKLLSNVYSSIAFDGTLKLNEGELLHIKLGLPKERSTLLHYDADLYVVKGDVETHATQKYPGRYNIKECSDDYSRLNIFPSLDFCSTISLPKPLINTDRPFIPVGGRIEYDFTLIKKDPGLQGVEFITSLHQDKDANGEITKTEAKISFNTPGSSADREYTIDYKLDRNDKTLKVEVKSPKRKISLNGNYVDGENQKEGKLTLNYNNEQEYSLSGKASVKRQGDKITYSPVWEFNRPNSKTVVKGTVIRTVGKKIEFDLKSDPSSDKKVQLKGFVQRDGPLDFGKNFKADTDLTIVLPFIEGKIAGTFKNGEEDGEEKHDLDLKGEYNLPGGDKRSGTLKLQRETKLESGEIKIKRLIEWTTGRFPEFNFHGNALIEKIDDQFHSFLEAKWGKDFNDPNHKLFYERTYKFKKSGKSTIEGEGKLRFVYPRRNIDLDVKSKLKLQPKKQLNYDLDVKYSGDKTIKLHAEFKNESTSLDHYEYEISIDYPGRQIVLRHDFEEKSPKVYKGDLYFQWQKGEHVSLASQYKDKSGPGVVYFEADVVVTLYDSPKPIRKYKALINLEHGKIILLGKVERPDKTYLVDINYEYPAPYTANTKIEIKLPWIEGKVNSKRAPGEFDGSLDFTTEKRRIVGDAKLKGDTHKVLTANFKWDAGRDESKKIALKANIERPRVRAANVKGTLDTPNYNFKGDIRYELPYELFNGQHNIFFDIEYAPGKKATVDAKINVDKSNADRRLSHGEIKVNTPSIQNLKVAYNTDFHKLPDQRSFKADVNVDSTRLGNIIVNIDHLRGNRKIDSAIDVTYGEGKTIGAGIGVYFDVGSGLGFDVGGSLKLKTPLDGLRDFEITIREGFKRSSEYAHIIHENHLRWGPEKEVGAAFEWTRKYDAGKGFEVGLRLEVDTPNPAFRHQKIQAEVEFHKDPILIRSNFDAIWGADKQLKYLVFYKREGGKIDGHLLADGRAFRPEGYVEILYNRNPIGADKYSSHGSIKFNEVVANFVNKGYWSPEKKSADLTITVPESFFPSKVVNVKGTLTVKGIQRVGDAVVTWGDKKENNVNSHGEWTVSDNGVITGKITVDPSKLGIDKVTADINSQIGGPKRSYNTKLILGPERVFDIGLNVNDKDDQTGKTAVGALKINNEDFISVDIDLVDAKTKKNSFGRLLSFSATLNNPLLSFTSEAVLLSEHGLHPSAKICTIDKVKCLAFSSLFDLHHLDPKLGLIDNNVHVKFTAQRGPDDSRTIGFVFHTSQVRNKYEHFFKWLISEEQKKYVGYSYTKEVSFDKNKPGSNRVYQILLPSRTLEAESNILYSKDGYTYNLHVHLDAVRQPNEELLVNVVVKNSTAGGIYTRNSRVTIKHPKLTKDLSVTNLLKIGEQFLYSQKTEIDLSSDPKKKITVEVEILDQPSAKYPHSHNCSFSLAIRQQAVKNLNGRISGNLVRGPETRTTNVEFYWLTKSGTAKVYTLHSELDKVADTIEGSLKTPYREFSWDGVYRHFEDLGTPTINANINLKYNGKLFRRAALDYSRGPEYNIKYYVDPADTSRLFRLHGGVVEDDTYSWTATRVKGGQEIQDFDIFIHLNHSNLLFNNYRWRVGLLQDVREGLEARVDKIGDDVQEALQNFAGNFKDEVVNKVQLIRDTLKTDLVPLGKYARGKLQTALTEFEDEVKKTNFDKLKDVLATIFGEFFELKDINARIDAIHNTVVDRVVGLRTKISELSERWITKLSTIDEDIAAALADLPSRIQQFRTNLRAKIPEIAEKIRAALAKIREAISNIIENQQVSKGLQTFREIYDSVVGRVKESLARITESLFGSGDGTASLYERIRTKLWEYAEGDGELAKVLKGVLTAIKSLREKACELIEDAKEFLQAVRQSILERLSSVYKKLEENPDFKALLQEAAEYRQQLKDKYLHGDLSTKEGIRKALDKVLTHTRERIEKLTGDSVFDLKNGHVQFYVPLVVPIDSLRSVRESFNIRQLWFELSNRSPSFSLLDAYQRAKPYFTRGRRDLLPPYNAQAMLIGNQHFMTFDKRFYDFAGKCQYVLTRDFNDANFTVILNYDANKDAPTKISFIIISDSHHVEIKPDSTVILDEQEVELPIQIETTVIQRHWNIIRVENNQGFAFTYDVAYDVASVNISGWYFRRVAGLFGNNDNEPDNDLEHTQRNVTSSIAQFAYSWDVSHKCSSAENHASDKQADTTTNIYHICNQLFHSDMSTFDQCSQYVKSDDFIKICLQEGIINIEDVTNGICRAVAGYKHACAYHGVNLQMPPKCVRCETPQGSIFIEGKIEVLKDSEIPKSADIVFIMEQKECNRRVLLESLDEVAEELDKELVANGLNNNRYGIVGFGGDGSQQIPHSHTARGQIFTDAASVIWALKNMAFSSLAIPSDTLGAIQLAADYPFRTGVAKICILYLCKRCSESGMTVDYHELRSHLLHQGISLHVLTPSEIHVKIKSQLAHQIIGIDAYTTYSATDINQDKLLGDAHLRSYITGMKDNCFTLAQELNGSIFRSDLIAVRKSNLGKNVKSIFVRRLLETSKPSKCQICICWPDTDGVGQPRCKPCDLPTIRQVKSDADDNR